MYINNYRQIVYSDELYHHGILGMKWGVRHDQYPLDASEHTAAEKKAGWEKSLDGGSDQEKSGQASDSGTSSKERKGLSDRAKRNIKIGLAVAGTALAAYGIYKLSQKGAVGNMAQKGRELADFSIDDREALSKINPRFKEGLMYQMNCGNSTIANELAKRGVQGVSAGPNPGGMTIEQMKSYFKLKSDSILSASDGFGIKDYNEYVAKTGSYVKAAKQRGQDFTNALSKNISSKFPEGSRGNVMIPTKMGSHWISWKVMAGGKVNFENPQDPGFDLQSFFTGYHHVPDNPACQLTALRLDNADFDMSRAHEVVNTLSRQAEVFNTFKRK